MISFIKENKNKNIEFLTLKSLLPGKKLQNSIEDIFNLIIEQYRKLKRPLKIGLDISTCPRLVFLQLLRYCIENDLTSVLTFFYSEGKYDVKSGKEELFSSGDWETIAIPGYTGKNVSIDEKEFVIISFGFETKGYIGWIEERIDTIAKIGLLFPYPGYSEEYIGLGKKKLAEFKKRLHIENKNMFFCEKSPAGDAIETWKKITDCNQ